MPDLETNKQSVIAFYEQMFNECEPRKAIKTYAGAEYIQHNPHVRSGKDGFIEYFEKMTAEFPGKRVEIKRAFAEGNHVILHCHQIWPATENAAGLEYAGIDIFRLDEAGKIVEHWDVLQEMPVTSAHTNGMF